MYKKNAITHVIAYTLLAPIVGGVSLSFLKYVAEAKHDIITILASSIVCALAPPIFFGTQGIVVSIITLPLSLKYELNPIANLLASNLLTWWVHSADREFSKGYMPLMYVVAVLFAIYICNWEPRSFITDINASEDEHKDLD